MKRRFRISLLLGVIFIFSVAFVNADEVDSNEQDAVNDITTEQNIEVQVEQDNHGNGIQTSNPKMEAKANNNTDVQAPPLSARREPRYNSWVDENGNRYYVDSNGNYVKGIYEINNVIYFFDPNTGALKREAGWRTWGNGRYFTNGEGVAYRSRFITFGVPKFYMGADGAVKTGIFSTPDGHLYNADDYTGEVIQIAQWIEKNGKKYFSNSEGELYKNQFITFGIPKFYMGADGSVKTGIFATSDGRLYNADERTGEIVQKAQWIEKNGKRYFSNSAGELYKNQFITFGIPKFYMGADGSVKTGIFATSDGRLYNADERTGEIVQKAQWIEKNGKRYFSNSAGELYKNQFITFGKPKFYMGADGSVKTGIFATSDGRLYNADEHTGEIIQKAQWIEKNGKRYFSNSEGELYRSRFISFGNIYYYMDSKGAVVVGSFYYNGEAYSTEQDGAVKELMGPVGSRSLGIDVSYAQGFIDWEKVARAGIKFAYIRASYRGYGTGRIVPDEWFERNIKGAIAAGIKVGVYFFSQAINAEEGREEADYIINQVKKYKISLPIAIDTEYVSAPNARANSISKQIRTEAVKAFCARVYERRYTALIYASTSWLNNQLDMSKLSIYKVWVAQYYSHVTYGGEFQCWQYTSSGSVPGINGRVDMNHWYNR
ncbi:GH25 family lysozyme [Mogibacterium timidum]|uniref:GH25 family lysozyme n=1 Tax=Mogibacterium timidum TaxID=35519 RepID=UPI002353DB8F|nr:GH25 family lysozyme [Mogibacterium timidum]